jgi:hypothetical protein
MKILGLMFLTLSLFSVSIFSQDENQKPCSSPEADQFDFWLGEWKAEWKNSDSSMAEGTNTIKKILGGCTIAENFDGKPGNDLIGKSFSAYNPVIKKWQQTWVDNYGSYMVFTGGFENDKMILEREIINREAKKIKQRMVFYNIEKNNFDWNWEKSVDDGKTWELSWEIHYSRKY